MPEPRRDHEPKPQPPFEQYDLFQSKANRDEGIERVSISHDLWMHYAIQIVYELPKGWRGCYEDIRPKIEAWIGEPKSPNAHGALANRALNLGLWKQTGKLWHSRRITNNHRNAAEYERI